MLEIKNYHSPILKDISFSLKQGQNLLILGENGVGKSTLAKVLCGIESSNTVSIQNKNLQTLKGRKRSAFINYIPPKLEIFDAFLSVKDFLSLSHLAKSPDKTRLEDIAQKVGITHLLSQSCQSLSSGEAQLLMVASSLLHASIFTVFDEPTANLDPQKIQKLFKLFQDPSLLESKIIISHNLDFAYQLGFDILFLKDKGIAFYGSNKDFFRQSQLDIFYEGVVENKKTHIMVKL